jgi:hypothetical protein
VQCVWGNAVLCRSLSSLHACFGSGSNSPSSAVDSQGADQSGNSAQCSARASYGAHGTHANTDGHKFSSSTCDSWQQPTQLAYSVLVTPPERSPVQQQQQQERPHLAHFDRSRQSWRTWQQQQQHLCQLPSGYHQLQQQWRSLADSARPERREDITLATAQQQAAEELEISPFFSRSLREVEAAVAHLESPSTVAPEPEWASIELHQQQQSRQRQQQSSLSSQRLAAEADEHEYIIPVHALHLGAEIDAAGYYEKYEDHFVEAHLQLPPHRDHIIFQVWNEKIWLCPATGSCGAGGCCG